MKKSVELLRDFRDLMEPSKYHDCESGNGIVMVFRFDKHKLDEKKSEIAEMLKEIREKIINKMSFVVVNSAFIEQAISNEEKEEMPKQYQKTKFFPWFKSNRK